MRLLSLLSTLPAVRFAFAAANSQNSTCKFKAIVYQECHADLGPRDSATQHFLTWLEFGSSGVTGPDGQDIQGGGIVKKGSILKNYLQENTTLQAHAMEFTSGRFQGKKLLVNYKQDEPGAADGALNFQYEGCEWSEPNSRNDSSTSCNDQAHCTRENWNNHNDGMDCSLKYDFRMMRVSAWWQFWSNDRY